MPPTASATTTIMFAWGASMSLSPLRQRVAASAKRKARSGRPTLTWLPIRTPGIEPTSSQAHRFELDVPGHQVADAGDQEESCGVEDVGADDDAGRHGKGQPHHEREERAASDRGQPDDKPADGTDRDGDDPVTVREPPEPRPRSYSVGEGLGRERDCPEDQRSAEYLGLDRVGGIPVPVRQECGDPDTDQGRRRASGQHPAA